MKARLSKGWLVVGPYEGNDMDVVHIQVGSNYAAAAFLDYEGKQRVAKIRPNVPPGRHMVSMNGKQLNHVVIE